MFPLKIHIYPLDNNVITRVHVHHKENLILQNTEIKLLVCFEFTVMDKRTNMYYNKKKHLLPISVIKNVQVVL